MTKRLLCFMLSLALIYPAGSIAQTVSTDLAQGIRQVEEGDMPSAIITLDGVVQRLTAARGPNSELALAHLYLGAAHMGVNQGEKAKTQMREAWRHNKALKVDPKKFPPRVIQAFEAARAEGVAEDARAAAAAQAAAPAKTGGSKTVLVVGGLAAAGAGVALATKKEVVAGVDNDRDGVTTTQGDCDDRNASVGPTGTLQFSNARFEASSYSCPRGTNLPDGKVVLFDAVNNSCAVGTISQITATMTVVARSGTSNTVGQELVFTNVSLSTNVVAGAGTRDTLRATIPLNCSNSNTSGTAGIFNDWSAQISITSGAGLVTLRTSNTTRTVLP